MKLKLFIGATLFLFAVHASGQDSRKENLNDVKVNVTAERSVDVEFPVEKAAGNVLVLVTDQSGNTVFLSSENNFKGTFKRKIDLSRSGKGKYDIKIVKDTESINKKIEVK